MIIYCCCRCCVPPQPLLQHYLALPSDQHRDDEEKIINTTVCIITTLFCSSTMVLWSEASIVQSGCGPILLNDVIERVSYLIVFVGGGPVAGFSRVAFPGEYAASVLKHYRA
jgi:hypothetical protein